MDLYSRVNYIGHNQLLFGNYHTVWLELTRLCAARVAMVKCANGDVSRAVGPRLCGKDWRIQRMESTEGRGSPLNERSRVGFLAASGYGEVMNSTRLNDDGKRVVRKVSRLEVEWIGGCDGRGLVLGWKVESSG